MASPHYSSSYAVARDKFRSLTQSAKIYDCLFLTCVDPESQDKGNGYSGVNQEPPTVKRRGVEGEDLSIDIAVFGNVTDPRYVLLHSSGLHGVEGFAGSAIQLQLISESVFEKYGNDACIVFVHCLNPYGMSYHRRWNENNVDGRMQLGKSWEKRCHGTMLPRRTCSRHLRVMTCNGGQRC